MELQSSLQILSKKFYTTQGKTVQKTFKLLSKIYSNQLYSLFNAIDMENQKQKITIKTISKPNILNKQKILCEINNHTKMNQHQNFIHLKDVYEDQNYIYIIMNEWGLTLQQVIKKRKYLSEKEVRLIFSQLVNILQHLRRNNIAHKNITLRSLLVSPTQISIKLSDFSQSVSLQTIQKYSSINFGASQSPTNNSHQLSKKQITPYSSYEQINGNFDHDNSVLYDNDIWAVGVIIFVLLIGEQPFCQFGNPSALKIRNYSYQFPDEKQRLSVSNIWKQLIKRIFIQRQKRIKLYQLIEHPLKMGICQNEIISENILMGGSMLNNFLFYDKIYVQRDKRMNNYKKNKNRMKSIIQRLCSQRYDSELNQKMIKGRCDWLGDQQNHNAYEDSNYRVYQKNQYQKMSCVIKMPSNVHKFHYANQIICLGYVINKSVGVLFPDGSIIIGHDQTEYQYYNYQINQSSNQNTIFINIDVQQSIKVITSINSKLKDNQKNDNFATQKSKYYQTSNQSKNYQSLSFTPINNRKHKMRNLKKNNKPLNSELTKKKIAIYHHFLKFYGKRVIKDNLSLWIQKVYKKDSLWIFKLNNNVWQVNMGDGVFLLDQYGIGWWINLCDQKNNKNNEYLSRIKKGRKIVNSIKSDLTNDKLGFQSLANDFLIEKPADQFLEDKGNYHQRYENRREQEQIQRKVHIFSLSSAQSII